MFSINFSTLVVPGGGGLSISDVLGGLLLYWGLVSFKPAAVLGPSGNLGTGAKGSLGLLEPARPFCCSFLQI